PERARPHLGPPLPAPLARARPRARFDVDGRVSALLAVPREAGRHAPRAAALRAPRGRGGRDALVPRAGLRLLARGRGRAGEGHARAALAARGLRARAGPDARPRAAAPLARGGPQARRDDDRRLPALLALPRARPLVHAHPAVLRRAPR